jgi:exonuclease SbcC
MIPLRLSVRNFLCYRDDVPPLDLRGIHVACLCGANGHGKSALLDAMTWCLWGHARTGTQNHNDLIAYGESECRVELDFSARGQAHRAIRRRRQTGQGRTEVDLFILDDAGQPRSISGNSVRETNWKIQNLVGMDYNTFVNTAFLLQGRSDEFTRKTPAERKAVLSSILDLGLYESLQASAGGRRDQWQTEVTRTEGALAQNLASLEAIADPTKELASLDLRLLQLGEDLEIASAESVRRRKAVAELRQKQAEAAAAAGRIESLRHDIVQTEAEAGAISQRISGARALEERSFEICSGTRDLELARVELVRLETARVEYDRLRARRSELQAAIDREQAALDAQITQLQQQINDVFRPAAARSEGIAHELDALASAETSVVADQAIVEVQKTESADLQREIAIEQAELERCIAEGKDLRSKQTEMLSADARCPLCRTPLSEDTCGDITAWYDAEIQAKIMRHDQIKRSLSVSSDRLERLQADIVSRSASFSRRLEQIQRQRGRLEQEQRQCEDAKLQLETLLPQLEDLRETLSGGGYAGDKRKSLVDVDAVISSLGYYETSLQEANQQVRSLQHWETERRDLQDSRARLLEEESSLNRARDRLNRLRAQLAETEMIQDASRVALVDLPEAEQAALSAGESVAKLSAERDNLLARQGRLQGDADRRKAFLEGLETLKRSRYASQTEQAIYSDLFGAFGRSGVPAMLIDAAVPRIEAETNLLLGHMTDNRLAVKLETQRVRQAGNVSETLDIFVSDELGFRNYDLFSGGEAFRINLSLRIALSKVLARRMGLPLPTLFIDEGFGTQDAAGRERIVDAIASIQDEFDKIIVITHLDELKDLFPVRIEVLKTADGSQFWLS